MYPEIDYRNDPRLSILNAADKCSLPYKQEGSRFTAICPFCGAAMGHFYLTPVHGQYYNVYKYVKCNKHGSALELYAELHNCSTKDAFKELIGYQVQSSVLHSIEKSLVMEKIKQHELAPLENRNQVYQDKEIKKIICWKIMKEGLNLKGIPGFYTDYYGKFTFWTPKEGGFLVPVMDSEERIQGCQIRKDNVSKKKYPWFSSSYMENGSHTSGFIHVHWNKSHSAKKVVITEGPLKATVASILSNTTF